MLVTHGKDQANPNQIGNNGRAPLGDKRQGNPGKGKDACRCANIFKNMEEQHHDIARCNIGIEAVIGKEGGPQHTENQQEIKTNHH